MTAATTGERRHHSGREDLAALRRRAEPGRLDHGRAEDVAVLDRHVTEADADADGQLDVRLDEPLGVEALLDRDGRRDRAGRRAEGREEPVAETLHDATTVAFHHLGDQRIMSPPDDLGDVLAEVRPELGRPDEVGEQHGQRVELRLTPLPVGHGESLPSPRVRPAGTRATMPRRSADPPTTWSHTRAGFQWMTTSTFPSPPRPRPRR